MIGNTEGFFAQICKCGKPLEWVENAEDKRYYATCPDCGDWELVIMRFGNGDEYLAPLHLNHAEEGET